MSKEALKLALEEIKELVNQYVQIPKHHSSAKTITIIEQALEQPAPSDSGLTNRYTAAQRPWVGLTDEQRSAIGSKIFPSTWNTRHVEFARAIEAELKELNT